MYEGVLRLNAKDNFWYQFHNNQHVKKEKASPEELAIIQLYDAHPEVLIDPRDSNFYKGYKNIEGKPSGQRIKILPNGNNLASNGFSLFANNLTFNNTDADWAVRYQNSSGSFTYLYDEQHLSKEHEHKSKLVDQFIKYRSKMIRNLTLDLENEFDLEKLALYVLMRSYLRVGNWEYFIHNKHQGLTTLLKENVSIDKDTLHLQFIGKDGVPQKFKIKMNDFWMEQINRQYKSRMPNEFLFSNSDIPIHPSHFSTIMHHYTGVHFYPHLIRSAYADKTARNFLKTHSFASKDEVDALFLKIAKKLGHKKYNKKKNKWLVDDHVTIKNYIRPDYVLKLRGLYEKKV